MFPDRAGGHPFKREHFVRARYPIIVHPRHHGQSTYTGVPRDTAAPRPLRHDELCGFLVACALVRPS
jgi:hypothetical protein